MNIILKETDKQTDLFANTICPVVIEEQLDTALDSGTLQYIITEQNGKGLNEALASYSLQISDDKYNFVGMDSRALARKENDKQGVYVHQVALTEPSKLLQGVMIDGFGVTQPENYNKRQSLLDVVKRLLAVTPFDYAQSNQPRFKLTADTKAVNALKTAKSPEFKWNTQTSLWECLLQIGAVIDAMPRLVADANGDYNVVTFDFVNAYSGECDCLCDSAANAFGENINETYYNTALSAVVENLRENE